MLTSAVLQRTRKQRGWTQVQLAERLGVSQTYVALWEAGHRPLPQKFARKTARLLKLSPVCLPVSKTSLTAVSNDELARDLGRLGYPEFSYLSGGRVKNPAEVLVAALVQPQLDSRVAEALPWLLVTYPEVDSTWLVRQARLLNLTNRMGFVVDLAREVARTKTAEDSPEYEALTKLSEALRPSRLDTEDSFGQAMLTENELNWLRENRSQQAEYWHVLSDWRPELLPYA